MVASTRRRQVVPPNYINQQDTKLTSPNQQTANAAAQDSIIFTPPSNSVRRDQAKNSSVKLLNFLQVINNSTHSSNRNLPSISTTHDLLKLPNQNPMLTRTKKLSKLVGNNTLYKLQQYRDNKINDSFKDDPAILSGQTILNHQLSASQFMFQAGFESGLYKLSSYGSVGEGSTIFDEKQEEINTPTKYKEKLRAQKKRMVHDATIRRDYKRTTMYKEPNTQSGMLFLYSSPHRKTNLFNSQKESPKALLSPSFSGKTLSPLKVTQQNQTKNLLQNHTISHKIQPQLSNLSNDWLYGTNSFQFDPENQDYSPREPEVLDDTHPLPLRMNDLLSRMQTGLVNYEDIEKKRGGLMTRVFKVRTMEQKLYPSIMRYNQESIK